MGQSCRYVFEGEVVGDYADAYAVADHEHEGGGAELVGEVFGVAWEVEVGGLDVAFVDGSCDEDVDFAGFEVFAGAVEAFAGEGAGYLSAFAEVYLYFILCKVEDVVAVVEGFRRVVDDVEVHLLCYGGEEFFVVGSDFGGTVEHGGAEVEHAAVAEGFDDDFVADAVDVAVGDGDAYFLFFVVVHIVCFIVYWLSLWVSMSCICKKA